MQDLEIFKPYRFLGLRRFFFSLGALVFFFLLSCERETPKGYLHIEAPGKGHYEIYRISGGTSLHFISEEMGQFNQDIALDPGSYLIFSDCSSETVVINPDARQELVAHQVDFIPPTTLNDGDKFLIQCVRHEKTASRQRITNQFKLFVLAGKRDLLVGMAPLKIDFSAPEFKKTPQTLKYELGVVRVESYKNMGSADRFFVSPSNEFISVTESQTLGNNLFLLPGDYRVELNGTENRVVLDRLSQHVIKPAFLKVETSTEVDLQRSSAIRGNPLYVEINGGHLLNLNEVFPVLPGLAKLRLSGSDSEHYVDLVGDEFILEPARSVQVDLDCPPWDWNCMGSKAVFLFEKDQHYPFASGVTDVPILFFNKEAFVSLAGTRDVRYELQQEKRDTKLKSGTVHLIPVYGFRQGYTTDLVRIEASGPPFWGNSMDLRLDEPTELSLITGSYLLTRYVSQFSTDAERIKSSKRLTVKENTQNNYEFPVFFSEQKLKSLRDRMISEEKRKERRRHRNYSKNYQYAPAVRFR